MTAHFSKRTFTGLIHAGEVAIMPAGTSWSWQADNSSRHNTLLLFLRPLFVRNAVAEFNSSFKKIELAPQIGFQCQHIRHIAMSLLTESQDANMLARLYADSLAVALAMQLARHYNSFKDLHVGQGGMAPHRLRKVMGIIDEHLTTEQEGPVASSEWRRKSG